MGGYFSKGLFWVEIHLRSKQYISSILRLLTFLLMKCSDLNVIFFLGLEKLGLKIDSKGPNVTQPMRPLQNSVAIAASTAVPLCSSITFL